MYRNVLDSPRMVPLEARFFSIVLGNLLLVFSGSVRFDDDEIMKTSVGNNFSFCLAMVRR